MFIILYSWCLDWWLIEISSHGADIGIISTVKFHYIDVI